MKANETMYELRMAACSGTKQDVLEALVNVLRSDHPEFSPWMVEQLDALSEGPAYDQAADVKAADLFFGKP